MTSERIEWHPQGTPGPWVLGSNCTYETALVGGDGTVVADAAWTGGSGCELSIKNATNARAIAEVPAMVQALREAVFVFETYAENHKAKGTAEGALKAARNQAEAGKLRAILARIDGEG